MKEIKGFIFLNIFGLAASQLFPLSIHRTSTSGKTQEGRPDIYSLQIESHIKYRYAITKVTSRVANPSNVSQQLHFNMFLPDTAFIHSFQMIIDGKEFKALIKEKNDAKKEYQEAVNSGQSAGHIAVNARDSKQFTISVNVEAGAKADFQLIYEQFLTRTLGLYSHVINLNPGQVVRNFSVDVYIVETANIKKLIVPELHSFNQIVDPDTTKHNKFAEIKMKKKNKAHIKFAPTVGQQLEMMAAGTDEWTGQFSVLYDVDRSISKGGQVLVNDGYFVHFFSPENLTPLNKYTVFVLDISGSMEGRKLAQLKDAMSTILDQLSPTDYFNIVDFSSSVTVHDLDSVTGSVVVPPDASLRAEDPQENDIAAPEAYPATPHYIARAKEVISKMSSLGGTNIYDALKNSLLVAQRSLESLQMNSTTPLEPIILFLTDGDPTVGFTSHKKILNMVKDVNKNKCAIFSLGFGEGADMNFLRKISLGSNGFARTIYEASDAALQLNNFYRQIASPLLSNVSFVYIPGQVTEKSVTKTTFQSLFAGSEIVVAGQLADDSDEVYGEVDAISADGPATYKSIRKTPDDLDDIEYIESKEEKHDHDKSKPDKSKKTKFSLERLWAYLTVHQLLDQFDSISERNSTMGATLKNLIISLALKYKFVTPLTSMVVVKPNGTSEIESELASSSDKTSQGDKVSGGDLHSVIPDYEMPNDENPFLLAGTSSNNRLFIERFDEDVEEEDDSNENNVEITWLSSVLTENNTLVISLDHSNETSEYKLLDKPGNETYGACEVGSMLGGVEGVCVHFYRCLTPEITQSIKTYINYFCLIPGDYAGVCCLDDNFVSKEGGRR